MDIQKIKELALANGFKLKEQASGNMDLNAYVYDFANAIEREVKAQAVPEGYILIPKKMPDEVNDHLWDFMTDNFVCTNDYGDSFMACDDFDLEKFYAELVKAQEPAK